MKIQSVYKKLLSAENDIFYENIVESEKEFLMNKYDFCTTDVEKIFETACCSNKFSDRSIVCYVFESVYELGYDEARACSYITNEIVDKYFDYKRYGEDLCENESLYLKLDDNRCVVLY